ncbi:hypothetical protein PR202_ga01590 [Eleusine coracana subsp. coracana]|uniref:Uncharacterized protein n=1 Tax=Eleusine coracana subsp. coracana TaxID=191504 RepID=A0AAV5BGZ8_ELECO|nr:hypothetical protein QOZ80_2AG0132830 [Eleusine coracana subsp. coracana]GJM85162.1 hypothetical protein PR202_ga00903 [Eleusine coracana subsp. coracana]GJM85790.1 hypothetical protein PR202_ga01590 [Eleusine coracana subsp. coracana]
MHPPVAPQPRYRAAVNPHQQPRNSGQLAARIISMASSCDCEPCVTQRPPVAALQPSAEERAPEAAGTSSESAHQAAEARPEEPAAVEAEKKKKKKDTRATAEDAPGTGSCFGAMEPARRTTGEESARERLKRHRTEMAGRVRIPDMWGQERLLKDWVDCAVFDRPLAATAGLLNARDALVAECAARRSTGRPLRVQNGCS